MFRTVPLSIIRRFSLYTQRWYISYSRMRTELAHSDPARKLSANLYDIYHCCVCSEKLLMMDRGTVRNMKSFIPKISWEISASSWFNYKNLSRCTVTWTPNSKKNVSAFCTSFQVYKRTNNCVGLQFANIFPPLKVHYFNWPILFVT